MCSHSISLPSCYPDDNSGKPVLHGRVLSDVHRGGSIREEEGLHVELDDYDLLCILPVLLCI